MKNKAWPWHCKNKRWDFIAMPTVFFFKKIRQRFASAFDVFTLGGFFDVWFLHVLLRWFQSSWSGRAHCALVGVSMFFFKGGFIVTSNIGGNMIFFTPYFSDLKITNYTIYIYIDYHPPQKKIEIPKTHVNLMASKFFGHYKKRRFRFQSAAAAFGSCRTPGDSAPGMMWNFPET